MLLLLVIVWLVVVLVLAAWVGTRGWRLWKLARATQGEVDQRLAGARLQELPGRIAELERKQQLLTEALERLRRSTAEFMVLWSAVSGVRRQVGDARGFFTK